MLGILLKLNDIVFYKQKYPLWLVDWFLMFIFIRMRDVYFSKRSQLLPYKSATKTKPKI